MNEKALGLFDSIKLKNINENINVMLTKDCVFYDSKFYSAYAFGDTGINTPSCVWAKYKDFLDSNEEAFLQLDKLELNKSSIKTLTKEVCDTISFNQKDLNVFNAIISAGKSNFIAGIIYFEKGRFHIFSYGVTYTLKYSIIKIIPEFLIGKYIDFSVDTFYMFYKLLKDTITKKINADINVSITKNTSQLNSIVFSKDNVFIGVPTYWVDNSESLCSLFISKYDREKEKLRLGSPDKITNRSLIEASDNLYIKNDSIKHLLKSFSDEFSISKILNKEMKAIFLYDQFTEMIVFGELNE